MVGVQGFGTFLAAFLFLAAQAASAVTLGWAVDAASAEKLANLTSKRTGFSVQPIASGKSKDLNQQTIKTRIAVAFASTRGQIFRALQTEKNQANKRNAP